MSDSSGRLMETKVSDALFVMAMATEVISQCLGSSELPMIFGIGYVFSSIKMISITLALIKIFFFSSYSPGILLFSIALLSASACAYWYSGSDYVMLMSIFVIAAYDVDFDLICRTVAICSTVCIVLVISLSLLGVLPNVVQERSYSFGLISERRSLGFQHVNFLGGYVLLSVMSVLYLKRGKVGLLGYGIFLLLVAFLYQYVNTKTSAALLAMMMVLLFLSQHRLSGNVFLLLCALLVSGSLVLSFVLPYLYRPDVPFMTLIDELSSRRLSLDAMFLKSYSVAPFGQKLILVSSIEANQTGIAMAVLDNTYLHLLLRFGLVPFILYLGMYGALLTKSVRTGDRTLLIMCTSILVCGIAEKWGFMVGYNVVLLALFAHTAGASAVFSCDLTNCLDLGSHNLVPKIKKTRQLAY